MSPFWDSPWEKCKKIMELLMNILLDCIFVFLWFLAQYAVEAGLTRIAAYVDPKHGMNGSERWVVVTAHSLMSYSVLITVVVILAQDLCKVVLAASAAIHVYWKEFIGKIRVGTP